MSYEKQIDGRTKRALDTAIAKRQVSQDSYRAVMEGRITLQEAKDLGRENSPFGPAPKPVNKDDRTLPRRPVCAVAAHWLPGPSNPATTPRCSASHAST